MAIGRNLRSSRLRGVDEEGDDPRVGLVNLADVMLVFACGLMIAVIAHFDMELGTSSQSVGDVQELDADMQQAAQSVDVTSEGYSRAGTVYRDEETGTLYVAMLPGEDAPSDASSEQDGE